MPQIESRWLILSLLFSLLLATAGCSGSNSSAIINPDTGQHQAGWIDIHGDQFISQYYSEPDQCKECHGANYTGGISEVACYNGSCHGTSSGAPSTHHNVSLTTWIGQDSATNLPVHGEVAKMKPGSNSGFALCEICHGTSKAPFFGGGIFGPTCFLGCHGPAHTPHPNDWMPGDHPFPIQHTTTDPANAPVCARCHFGGAFPPPYPPAPPAGTQIGCFNNTLCHGFQVPTAGPLSHFQTDWVATPPNPQIHGNTAKAAPGPGGGFSVCQQCHQTDFSGVTGQVPSCFGCHGSSSPHPSKWLPDNGGSYFHMTTNIANAPVCAQCHTNEANMPAADLPSDFPPLIFNAAAAQAGQFGCFNSTLCHGPIGTPPSHTATWAVDHSLTASSFASITDVQNNCGSAFCHGSATTISGEPSLTGGTGPSCSNCHLGGGTAGSGIMHPFKWPNPKSSHPGYLEGLGNDYTSCFPVAPSGFNVAQYCHGPVFTSTASQTAAPPHAFPDWQTSGPVCKTCHSGPEQ